jgi:hypothetical protein
MTLVLVLALLASLPSGTVPRYEDYPAQPYTGPSATPDLNSHPDARRYRTVLRRAARRGANFAGHFTFVAIGCGTSCLMVAVVDGEHGTVFFPQGLTMVQWAGWWHEPYGPQYRLSSRLVVVYGVANKEETEGDYGVSYFLWNGTDFDLLRFEPRDRGRPPE